MGGLSPCCKNRGEQVGAGRGQDERVQFTRTLLKAEGAAFHSPLPHYHLSSAPVFGLGHCSSSPYIVTNYFLKISS